MDAQPFPALGDGVPLSTPIRGDFENRFGRSFESVRVHTGEAAAQAAMSVDARAFAYGNHIIFGHDAFAPETVAGERLLAHELVHVVQQSGGAPGLGIQRAPVGISRGIAGNCIASGMDNCTLGTNIHRLIQGMMISLYSPAMFAEVGIPGGGLMSPDCQTVGFIDLYGSFPIGIVPVGGAGRMFPAPFASFPAPAPPPYEVLLGSIKPFTMPTPLAKADLATYITGLNTFAIASGAPGAIADPMPVPTQPSWAVPGIPFPFSPATLPQMLHVFTTFDGMYWYFCRPMIELVWVAREAARLVQKMLDDLKKAAQRFGQQVVHAFEVVAEAVAAAARAVANFVAENWKVIAAVIAFIVVVILVIIFWEVIVAILLAAAAAIAAFFASAAQGLAAAAAVAALLLILLAPEEAGAAEPRPTGETPATPAATGGAAGVSGPLGQGESARVLRELLERLQGEAAPRSEPPEVALGRILVLVNEAERTIRLIEGGDSLVYVLQILRWLIQEQLRQQSLPMPLPPGLVPPGGSPPPAGAPPAAEAPSGAPPAGAPPSGSPPAGTPPSGSPPPSGNPPTVRPPGAGQSLASGGGGGSAGGAAVAAGNWPIDYEEVGAGGHYQVLPAPSVANGTFSILRPTNPGAILRVVLRPDGLFDVQNATTGNSVIGLAERSSLLPGGYRLLSGPLKSQLDADFSEWRVHHRRLRLADLVTPPLHFR